MDGSKLASVAGSVALTVAGLTIEPSLYLPWAAPQQSGGGQQAGGQQGGGQQGGGQQEGQQGGQQGQQGGQQGDDDADEGQPGESDQPEPQDVGEQPDADLPDAQDEPGEDDDRPLDRDDTRLDRDDTRLNRRGTLLDRGGNGTGANRNARNATGAAGANGTGSLRTGQFDDGSALFNTDPAVLDQRLQDTAMTLQRLEDQLIQRNDDLLRRLGQARQLSGERRLDALAQVLQDVLQQQREFMDYSRRVRLGLTGDGSLGNQTLGSEDAFAPEFGGDRVLDQRSRNAQQGAAGRNNRGGNRDADQPRDRGLAGDRVLPPNDGGNDAFEEEMDDDTGDDDRGGDRSGGNDDGGSDGPR